MGGGWPGLGGEGGSIPVQVTAPGVGTSGGRDGPLAGAVRPEMPPSTVPRCCLIWGVLGAGRTSLVGKGGSGVSDSTRLQLCGPIALFSPWGAQSRPTMWLPEVPGYPWVLPRGPGRCPWEDKEGAVRAEAGAAVLSSAEGFPALLRKVTRTKSLPKLET